MMDKTLFARLDDGTGYPRTNEKNILNPYMNWQHQNTQVLHDTIVAEAIQMRGVVFYYMPRNMPNLDMILGEDPSSYFDKAYPFAAYLNTFDQYQGNGDFFDDIGYSANDEITVTINPGLFEQQTGLKEPVAGDLFYFKMDNSLFEITWVEPFDPFYQFGRNPIRKLIAQKFIYSGEELSPELQSMPEIEDEFSQLDLSPVEALNGLTSTDPTESEHTQVKEQNGFMDAFDVINAGADYFNRSGVKRV